LRLDSQGNEVGSKAWTEGDASGYDLIGTSDGGHVISGMLAFPGDPAREKGDAVLIRVDADGNELWSRTYGKSDMIETAHSVLETSAGHFVCVGWQEVSFDKYGDDILIAAFDSDGTPLWERATPTTAHNLHEGLVECPDGTLVIVGSAAQPGRVFRVQVIKTEIDPQ
jgi:outer membrane protein assembly factor BamB